MYDFEGKNTGNVFDGVVVLLILLNVVVMSMVVWVMPPAGTLAGSLQEKQAQDTTWNQSISQINLVFTVCFVVEAYLKLMALGFEQYFASYMNTFDFFVVIISVAGDILESIGSQE